jgi:hypothetical protein
VTGVDPTPRHVELARHHLAEASVDGTVVEADAEELPFERDKLFPTLRKVRSVRVHSCGSTPADRFERCCSAPDSRTSRFGSVPSGLATRGSHDRGQASLSAADGTWSRTLAEGFAVW